MRTVVVGEVPFELARWLEARRARGLDLFDEVWEGEYHVAPAPHARHGWIDRQLAENLGPRARSAGLIPVGPINLGEPNDYRVPDAAFLRDAKLSTFVATVAIVVEIVSAGDETYDKFGFYFSHDVEELLIADDPHGTVRWYARGRDGFEPSDRSGLLGVTGDQLVAEIRWPPDDA